MPFWYRTMCEELFCIPILIYKDEDGNKKNNLFNIEGIFAMGIKKQNILYPFRWTDITGVLQYGNIVRK